MQSLFRPTFLLCVGILALAGCGKVKFQVAHVEGSVTCNGRPVTAGLVVFIPAGTSSEKTDETGRSASGIIQSDGSYELTTYHEGDGAIVGTHTVQIFAPAPDDDAPLTDANRYVCGNVSLKKTVEDGENAIDLDLVCPTCR
jgi:hypothetical protein